MAAPSAWRGRKAGAVVVLTISLRYLVARFRQSLLTIGGIAVGVIALTVIQALMGGFRDSFVRKALGSAPHVTVRRQSLEKRDPIAPSRRALAALAEPFLVVLPRPPLPQEEKDIRSAATIRRLIEQVPGVVATAPSVDGEVMLSFYGTWEPISLNGVLPAAQSRVVDFEERFVAGTPHALEADMSGVVLGDLLAERMRVRVGDRIVARGHDGSSVALRVVGLYSSKVYDTDNASAWVNIRRAQALLGRSGTVTSIQVRTADYNRAEETARRIEYAVGMSAESWMEVNQNTLSLLLMMSTIMYFVTVLTMTIAGFGIAGNLITTVSEKTFDIGVLRAMGMRAAQISQVFVALAAMMTVLGIATGIVTSHFLVEALSHVRTGIKPQPGILFTSETLPMLKDPLMYWVSGVFAAVVSVVGGLVPASRAARLEPLHIIRNAAG